MNTRRSVAVAVILAVTGVAAALWWRSHRRVHAVRGAVQLPVYGDSAYDTRAPSGVRIKVEVLNATTTHGLARRATQYLRDRGFDVVSIGTAGRQQQRTVVLDRSNHPAWARVLARAMRGREEARPDSSLYVDATVLVGGDWTPPPLPFYP